MKLSPDIKDVAFSAVPLLLDNVQINKQNFRDLTIKILITILKRDNSSKYLTKLLERI
jgi:hypothetical protein